jgi:SH3 domain-containing protein
VTSMYTPCSRRLYATVCLAFLSTLALLANGRQWEPSATLTETPVRIYPDANRTPLATLSTGTSVQIIQRQGDWVRISFWDKAYGDRTGFVRVDHVRGGRLNQPPPPGGSEARSQSTPTAAPTSTAPAVAATRDSADAPSTLTARPARHFQNAELTVQEGDRTRQVDVTVSYAPDTFQVLDENTRKPLRAVPYTSFIGGEYSYSKSPRWKSGLFISPFLFLSSGKKHWLLVKTKDDYAMLRLDKNNYKLIVAEWETRTGLKVEAEGENK